ncbi:hypothetical protein [Clostridium sp. C8]|uniref:hypothetical protein n=1 Tax=Clostridium sp. C8 TaxID=1667357 RepID=UPI00062E7D7B|nr:hypothetical protein [Clostridium sp. C8]KLE15143.1 hypothetical protein AAT22_13125 [Clostridium sp. C8]
MYIAFGRKVVDTEEVKNEIENNTEFKVIKDMSKGTKREDMLAFNLSIGIDILNGIIEDDYSIDNLSGDELFDEYISLSEELATDMEDILPDESIMDIKAYKWDISDNDIKLVIAITHEEIGEGKLKDVMRRLITQLE